jgi:hypothetical protein
MRKIRISTREKIRLEYGNMRTTLGLVGKNGEYSLNFPVKESSRHTSYAKGARVQMNDGNKSGVVSFKELKVNFEIKQIGESPRHDFIFDDVDFVYAEKLTTGHKVLEKNHYGEKEDGSWMGCGHAAIY